LNVHLYIFFKVTEQGITSRAERAKFFLTATVLKVHLISVGPSYLHGAFRFCVAHSHPYRAIIRYNMEPYHPREAPPIGFRRL